MGAILDEVSITGAIAGIFGGLWIFTWYPVFPEHALRGLFFAIMSGCGLVFLLASRPRFSFLILDVKQLGITIGAIGIGVLITGIMQLVVFIPWPFLDPMPPDMQRFYGTEAAIAETFFYFGIQSLLSEFIHPIAGLPVAPVAAPFLHQYVYGAVPELLLFVGLAFLLQSILFTITGRISVPMGIHGIWNNLR